MVIDTSAILAIAFEESMADWAARRIEEADRTVMSTVNLTECLIRFRDRTCAQSIGNQSVGAETAAGTDLFEYALLSSGIDFIPPDVAQAGVAADARLRLPLNLGDCFAYALAKRHNLPLLTLDRDFRNIDIPVLLPPAP